MKINDCNRLIILSIHKLNFVDPIMIYILNRDKKNQRFIRNRGSRCPDSSKCSASKRRDASLSSRREIDEKKKKDQNVPWTSHRRFLALRDAGLRRACRCALAKSGEVTVYHRNGHRYGASEATQRVLGRQRRAPTVPTTRSAPWHAPPSLR